MKINIFYTSLVPNKLKIAKKKCERSSTKMSINFWTQIILKIWENKK